MDAVVVDIDDTIVSTDRRRHVAWCKVLGREIPFQDVESSGSEEILRKYAVSSVLLGPKPLDSSDSDNPTHNR